MALTPGTRSSTLVCGGGDDGRTVRVVGDSLDLERLVTVESAGLPAAVSLTTVPSRAGTSVVCDSVEVEAARTTAREQRRDGAASLPRNVRWDASEKCLCRVEQRPRESTSCVRERSP